MGGGAAGMYQGEIWLKAYLEGKAEHPSLLRGLLPDQTSADISRIFNLGGYQGTVTTACSSSASAIGWAADLVASGHQKLMVAGGADTLSILTFAGFNSLRVVDPQPCAPFSLGCLPGAGARGGCPGAGRPDIRCRAWLCPGG